MTEPIERDPHEMPWRTGRKVGRTIYAQHSDEPSDEDELIGMMDTRALATEAVDAHNQLLDRPVAELPPKGTRP